MDIKAGQEAVNSKEFKGGITQERIEYLIRFLKQRDTIKNLEYLLWKLNKGRELNAQEISLVEKEEKEFWDYVLKNS